MGDREAAARAGLAADAHCELVQADFFALVADWTAEARYDAVLLDVDHSPRNLLHPRHASFHAPPGLERLRSMIRPGGVFGLWSDDPPDADFESALAQVFDSPETHVVTFANPLTGGESASTVYVARHPQPDEPRTTTA